MATLLIAVHALMLFVSGAVAAIATVTLLCGLLDVPYPRNGTRLERRGWWKEVGMAASMLLPPIAAGVYGTVMAALALTARLR